MIRLIRRALYRRQVRRRLFRLVALDRAARIAQDRSGAPGGYGCKGPGACFGPTGRPVSPDCPYQGAVGTSCMLST